ncbi:MAG: hypothetical protein LBS59_08650 [Puniceicoccales bacterium]|jgi:hypothetical protein|nr:hypothetical protein [Puniceicoccales bacterium]
MNKQRLANIIRDKDSLLAGRETPGRVTHLARDANGKSIFTEHNPENWRREQVNRYNANLRKIMEISALSSHS